MPFINEYISPEDAEKYGLAAIDAIHKGTYARDWTIDRDGDMYLRNVANGRHEDHGKAIWTFYWKGTPLTLRMDGVDGGGDRGQPGWTRWCLIHVNGSCGLPADLKIHQAEIIEDLKDALLAYKDGGVFSANTDYRIVLDVAEGIFL